MPTTEPLTGEGSLVRLDPTTGTLKARRYAVSVTTGPDRGQVLFLPETSPAKVGTQPEADLCLTDTTVSRLHLELQARADGVQVRDLQSRNGTFVSGVRLSEALITADSAEVTVGKTTLRIAARDEEVATPEAAATFGKAIGESPAMRKLFGLLERVAPTNSTVLLLGETGTGKEVLAESIHQSSKRKSQPFVVFDCASVAPALIESELFGHVKGAFTGAVSDRPGAFIEADGGTLFLDEVGELPLELQPKLLRALEALTVKRVGEDKPKHVDVRIVAATHRDLAAEVRAGRFRQDLYFRLAVVPVRVPPLRERPEDLQLLTHHFVQQLGRGDVDISDALLMRLAGYQWPGNVRELRNVVERALVSGEDAATVDGAPSADASQGSAAADLPFKEAKEKLVDAFTRDYIAALLRKHDGNVSRAARHAGLNRNWVQRLAVKYGIKSSD